MKWRDSWRNSFFSCENSYDYFLRIQGSHESENPAPFKPFASSLVISSVSVAPAKVESLLHVLKYYTTTNSKHSETSMINLHFAAETFSRNLHWMSFEKQFYPSKNPFHTIQQIQIKRSLFFGFNLWDKAFWTLTQAFQQVIKRVCTDKNIIEAYQHTWVHKFRRSSQHLLIYWGMIFLLGLPRFFALAPFLLFFKRVLQSVFSNDRNDWIKARLKKVKSSLCIGFLPLGRSLNRSETKLVPDVIKAEENEKACWRFVYWREEGTRMSYVVCKVTGGLQSSSIE